MMPSGSAQCVQLGSLHKLQFPCQPVRSYIPVCPSAMVLRGPRVKGAPECRMACILCVCVWGGTCHSLPSLFSVVCLFGWCLFVWLFVWFTFGSEGKEAFALPQCLLFLPGHMTPKCWLQCDTLDKSGTLLNGCIAGTWTMQDPTQVC